MSPLRQSLLVFLVAVIALTLFPPVDWHPVRAKYAEPPLTRYDFLFRPSVQYVGRIWVMGQPEAEPFRRSIKTLDLLLTYVLAAAVAGIIFAIHPRRPRQRLPNDRD
jgi:hypothetical protein